MQLKPDNRIHKSTKLGTCELQCYKTQKISSGARASPLPPPSGSCEEPRWRVATGLTDHLGRSSLCTSSRMEVWFLTPTEKTKGNRRSRVLFLFHDRLPHARPEDHRNSAEDTGLCAAWLSRESRMDVALGGDQECMRPGSWAERDTS